MCGVPWQSCHRQRRLFTSALIKVDDLLVFFILVHLPPQGSQYEVLTTFLASVLHHGLTFLLSFNEHIAFEYRHICLPSRWSLFLTFRNLIGQLSALHPRKKLAFKHLRRLTMKFALLFSNTRTIVETPSTKSLSPHLSPVVLFAKSCHSLRSQIMLPYHQRYTPSPHPPL